MNANMRRAVARQRMGKRNLPHHSPVTGIQCRQMFRKNRHGIQPILQAPGMQNTRDVGPQLNPSALGG